MYCSTSSSNMSTDDSSTLLAGCCCLGSRQASYTSHMSRMSYNSHGDLLNGKPPAMSGGGNGGNGGGGLGGKDYRSAANRVAASSAYANASSASRPTLVPDLVVEHSRHHYHHHHNQNHDYVIKPESSPFPFPFL